MVCVTWNGANQYCINQSNKRLPHELEWELAAKGAEGRPFPWGTDRPREDGVAFNLGSGVNGHPRDVETSAQDVTPEGVHDLGGNVAEWVEYSQHVAGITMMRGGSWSSQDPCDVLGSHCRYVKAVEKYSWGPNDGFRCARSVLEDR